MITRRHILVVSAALLTGTFRAEAQQTSNKARRLGLLGQGSRSDPLLVMVAEGYREGLRESGFVEGQNVVIEQRYGPLAALSELANELVRLNVEVILAGGTPSGLAAKNATSTIPIVVAAMADPVADGLVSTLAKPGANVTGVTFLGPELAQKRLELLKEILPGLSRLAVLQHPRVYSEQTMASMLSSIRAIATGISVQVFDAPTPRDFESAFVAMIQAHVDALIILPSPMFYVEYRDLVRLAGLHRLPATYWFKEAVEAGGLMCYGANFPDIFRRSGIYAGKILKGSKPGDLPVEQPTKFDLLVNLKTARALGLTIPRSVLVRADRVIH